MKIRTRGAMKYYLQKARLEAENECGFKFTEDFADIVLEHCKRKLTAIGKPKSYLPLLYRCELVQHSQMQYINNKSRLRKEKPYVQNVFNNALSSKVS